MQHLFKYLTKKQGLIIACIGVLLYIQVYLDLKIPDYLENMTRLIQQANTGVSDIYREGSYMLLCTFASILCAILLSYLGAYLIEGVSFTLREKLYTKTLHFSPQDRSHFSTSSLITRSTMDISTIASFIFMGVNFFLRSPFQIVWGLFKIWKYNWRWTATTLLLSGCMILLIAFLVKRIVPQYNKIVKWSDEANLAVEEHLEGIRVIHAYNAEDYQEKKFDRIIRPLAEARRIFFTSLGIINPNITFVMAVLTVSVYWLGASLIQVETNFGGKVALFASMVAYTSYAAQVIFGFLMLGNFFGNFAPAQISAQRIYEVLNAEVTLEEVSMAGGKQDVLPSEEKKDVRLPEVQQESSAPKKPDLYIESASKEVKPSELTRKEARAQQALQEARSEEGQEQKKGFYVRKPKAASLEFRNVSFRYAGGQEDVLHKINFHIRPGETFGILGVTGSGKTTLLQLILRFYDPSEGQILLDGEDIRYLPFETLRNKISYIFQEAFLFSGSVRSNLQIGLSPAQEGAWAEAPIHELDEEDSYRREYHKWQEDTLLKALEVAQAKGFVEALDEGLDAEVSQGGRNFSGGQRQRLSIARALVKQPGLLIFDDSFSALDNKTSRLLRKSLQENYKHTSQLIVGQQIAHIYQADHILVLDKGNIVGEGKHEDLMQHCSIYKKIADIQLRGQNLEQLELEENKGAQ